MLRICAQIMIISYNVIIIKKYFKISSNTHRTRLCQMDSSNLENKKIDQSIRRKFFKRFDKKRLPPLFAYDVE